MTDRPHADIAAATAAHARLLAHLRTLTDDDGPRPSRLPGWTVGHVLTHLARNADSHVRMLEGAARGEAVEQYDGGRRARNAAIEAGASRPMGQLIDDVGEASARLEAVWATVADHAWAGYAFAADGARRPCAALPFQRWREVEVHQIDLGTGPSWEDWPDDYVAHELPRLLATLPDRLPDFAARRRWAAWLLGRTPAPAPDDLVVGGWEEAPRNYDR